MSEGHQPVVVGPPAAVAQLAEGLAAADGGVRGEGMREGAGAGVEEERAARALAGLGPFSHRHEHPFPPLFTLNTLHGLKAPALLRRPSFSAFCVWRVARSWSFSPEPPCCCGASHILYRFPIAPCAVVHNMWSRRAFSPLLCPLCPFAGTGITRRGAGRAAAEMSRRDRRDLC